MALLKIKDFDPDYRDAFGGYDIKGLNVYSDVNNEKIGDVKDLLVDEQGYFRYFVVDLGFWAFGKKILLPIERSHVDSEGKHLYTIGLTKDQVEGLPEFNESLKINGDRRDLVKDTQPRSPVFPAETAQMPPVPPRPAQQIPPVGQVPPVPPRQGYPDQFPAHPPAHPSATQPPQPPVQPPSYPPAAQAQPGYPTPDPRMPQSYQPNPVTRETNGQGHSVLQRFEERLRHKRSEPGSHR